MHDSCRRCGYDLSGITEHPACPECALPMDLARGDSLASADQAYVQRLYIGSFLMELSISGGIAISFIGVAVFPSGSVNAFVIAVFVASLLFLIGLAHLASPDRTRPMNELARRSSRVCAVVLGILTLSPIVAPWLWKGHLIAATALVLIGLVAAGTAWFSSCQLMTDVAGKTGNTMLQFMTDTLHSAVPAIGFTAFVFALCVPVVFLPVLLGCVLWYLFTLDTLRRQLRLERRSAQRSERALEIEARKYGKRPC